MDIVFNIDNEMTSTKSSSYDEPKQIEQQKPQQVPIAEKMIKSIDSIIFNRN